ncbi:tyrosine-protein phosphatase [Nocardia sp. NPDC046763]
MSTEELGARRALQATRTYGSFGDYVRDGLGLSDTDIAALKAKMLS